MNINFSIYEIFLYLAISKFDFIPKDSKDKLDNIFIKYRENKINLKSYVNAVNVFDKLRLYHSNERISIVENTRDNIVLEIYDAETYALFTLANL